MAIYSRPVAQYTLSEILALATQHQAAGRLAQAESLYRAVLAHDPRHFLSLQNLGVLAYRGDRAGEAVELLARALAVHQDSPETWANMAAALVLSGRPAEAITACEMALRLRPDLPEVLGNLGNAFKEQGRIEEAVAAYRRAMEIDPQHAAMHSNLLLCLHYASHDREALYAEHRLWNQRHAAPLAAAGSGERANVRDPNRRLRLGYVSADLRDHAVARFLLPLLTHHDPERFEVFCYAEVPCPDDVSALLMPLVHQWRNSVGLSDEALAALIRRDSIDILIDLAGHTRGNRLLAFARRPAPVQVTYLGYPDTTGMDAIGYRLTDAAADPPGEADRLCSEQLVRLPRTAWCYQPPHASPQQRPACSQVVFGSCAHIAKLSEETLQLWGQVLRQIEGSRLRLKSAGVASDTVRQRVRGRLEQEGIAPGRIEFGGRESSSLRHFDWYNQVDIVLDTTPYHGTTTTCEALWMGVPVLTLAGESHVSRVGASLLGSVGLGEWVAGSEEEYIRKALTLAGDRHRLAALHGGLRRQMQASPLMDGSAFAQDVQKSLRELWRRWCEEGSD